MVKFMTFLVLLYNLKKLLRKLYESAIYLHRIIGVWVAVGFKWKMLKYYLKGLNNYECSKFGVNFLLSSDIDLYKLHVSYKLITPISFHFQSSQHIQLFYAELYSLLKLKKYFKNYIHSTGHEILWIQLGSFSKNTLVVQNIFLLLDFDLDI